MNQKEDEDITIDFSKIKGFFKRDKEEKKDAEPKKIESKDDDEISIDFGKIKNFFKTSKTEEKPEGIAVKEAKEGKKDSDEIDLSFDISKIKNFFKSSSKDSYESGEEISLDWSKLINFFKKYSVIFIALIPIIISIYIRMQASFLPITDDWAVNSVINGIKSQIRAEIDQQYPNLPDANKNIRVDERFQQVLASNKQQIDQQITATSAYFKQFFQDENGKNYMPDIDPYYWYRYAKNIVEHGHPGDVLKDGRPFDDHQVAPQGRFVVPDMFHAYFLAYFYKFLHFFTPDLTIMRSLFYYPVFVSALCVLLVFLIARRISGNVGGFFAALMMAVNAAFLGRTLFGHADSDAWVVFFPLLITWLFIATMDAKNMIKALVISSIAGFFTGLYTIAWTGWWYIFYFLLTTIAFEFLYLTLTLFYEKGVNVKSIFLDSSVKNIMIIALVYILSTAIFATAFTSLGNFKSSLLGPLNFPSIKAPVAPSLWPNVLTTVAELNEGSINSIINSIGGAFLFFISLLGIIFSISRSEGANGEGIKKFDFIYIVASALFYGAYFLMAKNSDISVSTLMVWIILPVLIRIGISIYKKDLSYDFKLSILLSLWVMSTIFASVRGIRFTLLLAPAFSVALGVALGKGYAYLSQWFTKELKVHKAIASSILLILLLLMYVNPIRGSIGAAGSDIPIVNDAWYNALTAIKQDSNKSAIITSWWDFGHHFKAISDRRVTFDGTTQTFQAAQWVGRLLMTDNERESIGILRMLDCGQNSAFDELFKINGDFHKSLKILNDIVLLDKKDAKERLAKYGLSAQQSENVLLYTHCNPPEAYLIASEDMIGKSGVWSHFGSWNFERADMWQNARKMPKEEAIDYIVKQFNYTKERAENIYFEMQAISSDSDANTWISPWPGYGGTASCGKNDKGVYLCGNGLQINLSNGDIFGTNQQGIVRPKAAAFTTENGLAKKEFTGNVLDFGVTVIPKNENELDIVLSSKELTGSIFTRTFYMQGHGLRYYKLFNHQRGLTGTDIYTYKIDWEGRNATIVDSYVKNLKEPVTEDRQLNINLESNNSS